MTATIAESELAVPASEARGDATRTSTALPPRREPAKTRPAERTARALADILGKPLVDVLLGRRPLNQVRSRVSRPVHSLLASGPLARLLQEPGAGLRSMHASAITPDLVEGCAVIGSSRRTRALVLRWERSERGWLCTFLSVV